MARGLALPEHRRLFGEAAAPADGWHGGLTAGGCGRQAASPSLAPPRSSAQFAHPDTVFLRQDGDYFVNDGPDAGPGAPLSRATICRLRLRKVRLTDGEGVVWQARARRPRRPRPGCPTRLPSKCRCVASRGVRPPSRGSPRMLGWCDRTVGHLPLKRLQIVVADVGGVTGLARVPAKSLVRPLQCRKSRTY